MVISEKILNVSDPKEEKFLRQKTKKFDFDKYNKKEREQIVKTMRSVMDKAAGGIGLAANQIGLDISVFVAKVDNKFYAIFNPEIVKASAETTPCEEGCLSISNRYERVMRSSNILLKGQDKNGKVIKIKAWGLLSCVFQHEVDHLNGKLYIDRL